jgi:hypothetical protein
MKHNYKNTIRTIITIIAVSLTLMSRNTNAQRGSPPWLRKPPSRQVIVPNPPMQYYRPGYSTDQYRQSQNTRPGYNTDQYRQSQNTRPGYNQYNQTGGVRPFLSFSIHFDPLISWFSTYSFDTRNDGVVPGFNFGITYNSYFGPNYSFSSGINIINAGGRLVNRETSLFEVKNYSRTIYTVDPGETIIYRVTYLSVPLGVKLRTNQIGYGRFFTDLGFDPQIVIAGRADIPSLDIRGGNALAELNRFNLSFHIVAGMEYPLSENNNFIFGIGFEKNLFDITRDNGNQPSNLVTQKLLSFRIGMTF